MNRSTPEELDTAAVLDLLSDAESCERQAQEGPFYPECGITKENLLKWAATYRERAAKLSSGGAHRAALDDSNG